MRRAFILFLLTLIQAAVTCAQNGPIAQWNFNGSTSDSSGNGLHATAYNCTSTAGSSGQPNTAYKFDGTSSYMEVGYDPLMNLSSFTIATVLQVHGFYSGPCQAEMILKRGPENATGQYGFIMFDNAWDNNNCAAFDTNLFVFGPVGPAASPLAAQYTPTIESYKWYRTIQTYDGSQYRLYINGELMNVVNASGTIGTSSDGMTIGRNYANFGGYPYWFDGIMDEIVLYDRALDTSEVTSLLCSKFITVQPQDVTVNIGNSALFSTGILSGSTYQWQVDTGSGFMNIPDPSAYTGINTGMLTATVPTLQMDSNLYRCIIRNELGCKDTTEPAMLRVTDPTNVQGVFAGTIEIFPNPSNGRFNIRVSNVHDINSVELIDIQGKSVAQTTDITPEMTIGSALARGIYVIRITGTNGRQALRKVVVQ